MLNQQQIVRLAGGCAGALVAGLLLVAAIAGVAVQAQAQPGTRFGRGFLGLDPPELRDAQREQIRGVMAQHREEIRALIERVGQARKVMQASAQNGQVNEAEAAEFGNASAALALVEARVRSQVLELLTPEQRFEVQTRRAQMEQRLADLAVRDDR